MGVGAHVQQQHAVLHPAAYWCFCAFKPFRYHSSGTLLVVLGTLLLSCCCTLSSHSLLLLQGAGADHGGEQQQASVLQIRW